ncbi:MAG: hypothetical protein AAF267_15610 [Deinococcota bacterium]
MNFKTSPQMFGVLLVVLMSLVTVGRATSVLELDLETMLDRAELAFFAEVVDTDSEERADDPWTLITFSITRDLRGDLPTRSLTTTTFDDDDNTVTLAFYGGQAGGTSLNVTDMPQFRVGEEVLILAYDANYYSPIVGFSQAVWRLSARGFTDSRGRVLTLAEDAIEDDLDSTQDGSQDEVPQDEDTLTEDQPEAQTDESQAEDTLTEDQPEASVDDSVDDAVDDTPADETPSDEDTIDDTTSEESTSEASADAANEDDAIEEVSTLGILLDGPGSDTESILNAFEDALRGR